MFSRTFTLTQEDDFAESDEPLLLTSQVTALLIEKIWAFNQTALLKGNPL